jgi:hypothetical protein
MSQYAWNFATGPAAPSGSSQYKPLALCGRLAKTCLQDSAGANAVPTTQLPASQNPLPHTLPWGAKAAVQPLLLSQPSVVHGFPSSQVIGVPAHLPAEQRSPWVHALPSLQVPGKGAWTQPLNASHTSRVHTEPSSQLMAWPLHAPSPQMSLALQALPSSHGVLLYAIVQPTSAEHASSVHGLPSLQLTLAPAVQAPPLHWSPKVQRLPSLQAALLAA